MSEATDKIRLRKAIIRVTRESNVGVVRAASVAQVLGLEADVVVSEVVQMMDHGVLIGRRTPDSLWIELSNKTVLALDTGRLTLGVKEGWLADFRSRFPG